MPLVREQNLRVLALKITFLRQKLVIICATRAAANLVVLALNQTPLFDRMHKTFSSHLRVKLRVEYGKSKVCSSEWGRK